MYYAWAFIFRKKYRFYSEELKTQQPKPHGMVERVARSGRLIVDGHHDLETDLRNKSGKVEHKTLWVSQIPPASFFFASFALAIMKESGIRWVMPGGG